VTNVKTLKGSKKSVVERENLRFTDIKYHSEHPSSNAQADLSAPGTLAPLVRTLHDTRPMPTTTAGKLFACGLLANYWMLLLVGTHLPRESGPSFSLLSDKVLHFAGFAGLALLLAWLLSYWSVLTKTRAVIVILICGSYGAIDELTQPLSGRTCEMNDWLADLAGATTGVVIFWLVSTIWHGNRAMSRR
jgi:VanZ family protein